MMILSVFTLMIVLAELLTAFVSPVAGIIVDSSALLGLVNYIVFFGPVRYQRAGFALALLPLLRILSLAVPLIQIPEIYWYVLVGLPFLGTMVLFSRYARFSWDYLTLKLRNLPVQFLVGLSGIPLGFAAYEILKPKPLEIPTNWFYLVAAALILTLFVGFLEEMLFRGILQRVAVETLGSFGIVLVSLIYALVYAGSLSLVYVVFVGFTGWLYALWVQKSGSLWGSIAARSLWNIGLLLIWPLIL